MILYPQQDITNSLTICNEYLRKHSKEMTESEIQIYAKLNGSLIYSANLRWSYVCFFSQGLQFYCIM